MILILFIQFLFNDVCNPDYLLSSDKLERLWKKAAVIQFEILTGQLSGETKENQSEYRLL
jgi:hypothetical protein